MPNIEFGRARQFIKICLALILFFHAYTLLVMLSGCNERVGFGVYTEDGACENPIYGYSIAGAIFELSLPFVVGVYVFSFYKYSKLFGLLLSTVLVVFSVFSAKALIALFLLWIRAI